MYFLLNMGIFQPAMLVYWRLVCGGNMAWIRSNLLKDAPKKIAKYWLTTYPTYPFTDNASSTQAPVFQPPFGPSFLDGAGSCSKINLVPKCHRDFKLPSAQRAVMSWWFQTSKCPHFVWFLKMEAIHFHGSETMISDHPCGATLHQLPPWQLGGLFFPKRWTPDTCPMDHMDSNGLVVRSWRILSTWFSGWWLNHPVEKYQSNWESSLNRSENKKYLKPPPI